MSLNIEGIKSSAGAAYQTVSTTLNHWKGRSIAWMQAGAQAVMPHLQDKKIAVISLIAVTLLLTEVADRIYQSLNKRFGLNDTLAGNLTSMGLVISIFAGVVGFTRYTQLPLSPLAILGTSIGAFVMKFFCEEKLCR